MRACSNAQKRFAIAWLRRDVIPVCDTLNIDTLTSGNAMIPRSPGRLVPDGNLGNNGTDVVTASHVLSQVMVGKPLFSITKEETAFFQLINKTLKL